MTKVAICSGCDSNYFPLLQEMIASVRRFKEAQDIDICIMNTGLTQEQEATLIKDGMKVHTPDWPCAIPEHKIRGREFLKSCVCRPFLPEYFPDYDTYMWVDADTWVQNWNAVELFLQGAKEGKMALTGNIDRAYEYRLRIKWLWRLPIKFRSFYFSNTLKNFGFKRAKKIYPYATLLAGAFALPKDAPHWKKWQEMLLEVLTKGRGKIFTAEQLTLGYLIYLEKYPVEILPAWCHWLCEKAPLWDEGTNQFVEPYLPRVPLGILHISGHDEMRLDRSITASFDTVQGNVVEKSLRYLDGA